MPKVSKSKLTISADILAELEALPRSRHGGTSITFTAEQDAIILKMWRGVDVAQKDFAKWWNKKYGWGSEPTLRRRYKELTEEQA